jgi:uncharacterized protein (TIGR04255 family)
MSLPKKISPCPILEANTEVRFDSEMPSEAVFGIVYNQLKKEFKDLEKLPILQIPEEIRSQDPILKFQACYRLRSENSVISIGPKVISFACVNEYAGWENYSSKVIEIFSKVKASGIINKTLRVGLRYINFFENNIFNRINLSAKIGESSLQSNNTFIKTEFTKNKFSFILQVANKANVLVGEKQKVGSIIDIDTSISDFSVDIFSMSPELVDAAHSEEKQLFFSLLKEDFLESLNPEY